jgi:N-acetylglutamate synthase-like GNAT family acetyltransferase
MVVRRWKGLKFRETTDFSSMRRLALSSGLEDGAFRDFVKAYGFYDRDVLVACAGLKEQSGVFSLECVAVKETFRGKGLGRQLVESLEDDARKKGATKIWALARTPAFFERIGYRRVSVEESEGPNLAACLNCRQYLRECNPSVVLKVL